MSSTSIAAALEAEPLGSKLTRFRTQTRTLATDAAARKKFDRRRREAEHRFRLERSCA